MGNQHFIGRRAYHYENGQEGVILAVHLDVRPQTAKFLPDGRQEESATWVNLGSLKVLPVEQSPTKTQE